MRITSPSQGARLAIAANTIVQTVVFTTDTQGSHTWHWQITWNGFTDSGATTTVGNTWNATQALADRGGTLTVRASSGVQAATVTVTVAGTNPSAADVRAYLQTQPDSAGFDAIILQESRGQQFRADGTPVRSFDNGYGICQLTNPPPTIAELWNWRRNIDAGLRLFGNKRREARTYLNQSGRTFTNDQLVRETVSRWNGGRYHRWNDHLRQWERNPNILCDPRTGNIGWDMTDARNSGQTLQQLRARDSANFNRPPASDDAWAYYGICYADHLLGAPAPPPPPPPPSPPPRPQGQPSLAPVRTRLA